MPFSFDHLAEPPRKGKIIKSAFDSESFDADGTFHVDGLVGSATISPSGRDVALASPEGLAIIDLDSPWSPPRRLSSHGLPWLVVDVQWSPFAARDYWVASTANHRCLVWNLNKRDDASSGAIEHSLQAHRRAITDINFSAHHPDFLATCAVDGYVHCWDLRRPRNPSLTFCDWFAGATQVKYSRQDPHVLASAHDRYLHIWDNRKTAEPLKTICAHTSKIYGVDWNRTKPTCLVTCSLDKSIKFWDYAEEGGQPHRVIRTDFPVWRARHTPFGSGLLAMPQNEPGNLYLYDRRTNADTPADGAVEPVAIFPGHGDHKVKEFLWRSRGGVSSDNIDDREFQLVSWGEDNELRLQKVDPKLLQSVGYIRGTPLMPNLNLTRKGATYKTFRTVEDTIHRDRRSPTMSDPRPGTSGQFRPSALTQGLNNRARRVGPSWRTTSMKARTNSSRNLDKSKLQIGWMKGITMSKRKSSSDSPSKADLDGSGIFDDWGEPETIQDEFLRINNQLPNVKWENIDMDSLTLKASLKGPWGVNGETIFIKVKIDIPATYPRSKAPRFFVEKTSFMPEETQKKLQHELHELARRFLERRENSIFVAFTYLLGEVDLETSTTWNVPDLDDDLDGLADESSSEEDESDIPTGNAASMSQELSNSTELDPTAALAPSQRAIMPPPPRSCGARFSNDGRLVCFFPTKEEKAKALFSLAPPDTKDKDKGKGEPSFAGFGRLAHDFPPPKHRIHDDTSATDDNSDDSDDTDSTSSTDSEPTTIHKTGLWYQPGRHFRRALSTDASLRSSGAGTGAGTGTGTGTSRRRPGKPKNVVSLHNYSSLLPSKKEFAEEYAIFGEGADVCSHNAAVADKYGYVDLANIWRYATLLLRKNVPLEVQSYRNRSVLVIAKEAVTRSGVDKDPGLSGKIRWGCHPLGPELIDDLIDYFERLADIQMVAMLTCIFGDSYAEDDGVPYVQPNSLISQPETPLPFKAPSFSLDYFPSDPALWNTKNRSQASSAVTTPRIAGTPAMYSDQGSDDISTLHELSSHSYSCGETPPKLFRTHLRDVEGTRSLSTSPNNKSIQRSNSSVAALAASFPRALAGMVSASPPDPPRKRPSPAETILSNFTPSALTWGASMFGGTSDTPGTATARTSISDDDDYQSDEIYTMVPVAVDCIPFNQGHFDDDGWMLTPLLNACRKEKFSYYRYAYSEMLQMWGQSLARLEILKFNVLRNERFHEIFEDLTGTGPNNNSYHYNTDHSDPEYAAYHKHRRSDSPNDVPTGAGSPILPSLMGGRYEQFHNLMASNRGLDVTGVCRIHEIQLDPIEYSHDTKGSVGGAIGVCLRCYPETGPWSAKEPQTQLTCVYCLGPVAQLYTPCLSCGCVSHDACLAEWHAMGETECPAGDECNCVHEAGTGQVESWTALQAAMKAKAPRTERTGTLNKKAIEKADAVVRSRRKSAPIDLGKFQAQAGLAGVASDDEGYHVSGGAGMGKRKMTTTYALDVDDDGIEREDWLNIVTEREIPSVTITGTAASSSSNGSSASAGFLNGRKPPVRGDEPISAARLSLGNRLKKQLTESARPGAPPRRRSGGVAMWRSGI
ncbi:maintenance of telomere capping protein 5 [Podospora australis]|uniref:Maintenance of telomere capping protein 5 n=1 Tax=Podospora australis TaxID=1536484 RepID=A0AAN6X2D1_9PEZI|nr:maintenance of telomere capping protein 5 [Podospora australis]